VQECLLYRNGWVLRMLSWFKLLNVHLILQLIFFRIG